MKMDDEMEMDDDPQPGSSKSIQNNDRATVLEVIHLPPVSSNRQYLTEEEEFELRYEEEMEDVDEDVINLVDPQPYFSKPLKNHNEIINLVDPQPCSSKSVQHYHNETINVDEPQPGTSKSIRANDDSIINADDEPRANLSKNALNKSHHSLLLSPQLSQISFDSGPNGQSAYKRRRLFGTPSGGPKRFASTPFRKTSISAIPEEQQFPSALQEIQNFGLNRKRRLEDLFGDIRDIEQEDYVDKEAKKMKNEEERDLELIEKILEARKRARETINPMKKDNIDRLNALHAFKMRNLSYTIPNWPCIPLVRSDFERVYVRMHSENYEKQHIDEINVFSKGYKGLLGESKEEIWNGAREITVKRLTAPKVADADCLIVENPASLKNEKLWVEKYKPKRYIDLLSDETTNRSLLYWLKMWDKVVFGREFRANDAKASQLNSFNKKTGKFESTGGWNRRIKQNLNMDRDEHGRPMQKIALLCGPPGLGKTTLAHTIAKHAGYNILELNASDDRSPEAFKLALENGTQMTSVLNKSGRPNCIILDEIDGAPNQSIDFLIRFLSDNYFAKAKKSGAKANKNLLKRPIICICNDMYTPSLRQLRQIAFVVNFPPIESSRLAERLLEIASKEHMKCDLGTMLTLAEKSGNDVRSCISMMQFFNANKKRLMLQDVLSSTLGQKDRHRGLFGVWSAIFQIQRPRRELTSERVLTSDNNTEMITMTNMSASTRAKHILEVVHMGGDYERLMQGVYENYLNQKMPDPNLDGVVEATNWFCFSDTIQNQINSLQNYSVYPYLQFSFIIWHLLFASLSWPKIQFPSKGFEINQRTTTQKMIFQSFKKGISGGALGMGQGKQILVETIPFLKRILSPHLRSVSLQLLTTKERYDLTHTVAVMADLGLAFTQVKAADGTYQYTMEPDIDSLCKFQGFHGIHLTYFGRQLIAREVELEQMRRVAPKITNPSINKKANVFEKTNKKKSISIEPTKSKGQEQKVSPVQSNLPNHLQSLKPKIRQNKNFKETISKDFFGRLSTKQTPLSTKEGGTDVIVKSPIWYRYKEGFNNAVRKDVTMSELL